MIYNKPRDFSWRLLPSLKPSSEKENKKTRSKSPDNLINETNTAEKYPAFQKNVDIILDGKPTFVKNLEVDENTIIDLTAMPVIEGIPILRFPDEPYKPSEEKPFVELVPAKAQEKPQKKLKAKEEKKEKSKNKPSHILKAASFFILLYFGTFIAFMIPLRPTYSESEKRELSKFPEFSFEALASGDYFDDISSWFSDTFPFRDSLTKIDSRIKELHGINAVVIHGEIDYGDEIPDAPLDAPPEVTESVDKNDAPSPIVTEPIKNEPETDETTQAEPTENNEGANVPTQALDAIIVAGDSAYEYYSFSTSLATRFINSVNAIDGKAKPQNNVYSMVIPTSIDITLNDTIRKDVNSSDQKKALEFFNGSTKNAIAIDSIFNTLRVHRNEYIYFRTDHHWTALGAYYAYCDFCKAKGITPIPLSDYEKVSYKDFTGTFYTGAGQSTTLEENADQVDTYTPFNNAECTITKPNGSVEKWSIIADVTDYASTMKYLTFIGGDNPLTTIKNTDNPNGETCVVIKDSYGNAFVPFLIPHYSTIYVIDPRHYTNSLEDFASDKKIDDVIFISNISTTRNEIFISAMEKLVK